MAFIKMEGHKGREHKVGQREGDRFINLDPNIKHAPLDASCGYDRVCKDIFKTDPIKNHENYVDRH